jgi:hypothetical protein
MNVRSKIHRDSKAHQCGIFSRLVLSSIRTKVSIEVDDVSVETAPLFGRLKEIQILDRLRDQKTEQRIVPDDF